ncbi:MAG: pitrilysin family protein [bacterium]|nr:pitrilysin family protein [bacterium]
MEYKKIEYDNYTFHLINTNRFKSVSVVLFYSKKFNKDDIAYGNLLSRNLVYSSKKYNTKNKMASKGEDLYGSKVEISYCLTGNIQEFVISLDFLNPKYTDNKYMDESLDFLYEIIFNPNIENNGFKEDYFNIIKNDVISGINSIKDNPNLYASINYAKHMYEGTSGEYSTIAKLEDVEKINPTDLYEFYKKLNSGEYRIDLIVYGDVDDGIINKINSKFKKLNGSNELLNLVVNHKYKNNVKEIIEPLPFNQSKLYIGYRLNELNYHEMAHVLKVYNTILGTMNDSILFNIVRENNSLCYSIGSFYSKYNPSLTIYAGINKDNYEKTVELIKECVNLMRDKNTLERLFEPAKKTINTYLNSYYDDMASQINKYYYDQFMESEDVETYRDNINKVTIDEVINLNDKINLSTIYLMKGDMNND